MIKRNSNARKTIIEPQVNATLSNESRSSSLSLISDDIPKISTTDEASKIEIANAIAQIPTDDLNINEKETQVEFEELLFETMGDLSGFMLDNYDFQNDSMMSIQINGLKEKDVYSEPNRNENQTGTDSDSSESETNFLSERYLKRNTPELIVEQYVKESEMIKEVRTFEELDNTVDNIEVENESKNMEYITEENSSENADKNADEMSPWIRKDHYKRRRSKAIREQDLKNLEIVTSGSTEIQKIDEEITIKRLILQKLEQEFSNKQQNILMTVSNSAVDQIIRDTKRSSLILSPKISEQLTIMNTSQFSNYSGCEIENISFLMPEDANKDS